MSRPEPPARWLEQRHDLPPALSAALAAYEDRAPTAADRAAIFAALEARLAAEATGAPAPSTRRRLRTLAGLGGLAVVLAVLVHRHAPTRQIEHAAPAVASSTAKPEARARAEPAASAPQAPASPSAASEREALASSAPSSGERGVAASATPASGPQPRTARAAPAPGPAPRTASSAPGLAPRTASSAPGLAPRTPAVRDPSAELALLIPARRVLSSDPARSLALAAEHARRFPRGTFAEERDLLRIEALLRSGQRAAAARHIRGFRRTYPGSAHLEHLPESFAP